MQIKVCGMTMPDNILEVARLKPDYLGFIFYPDSPRYFTGNIPEITASIKRVGVFVGSPVESVLATVAKHQLNMVQLHGEESAEYVGALKQKLPKSCKIWKVFSIRDHFNFDILKAFEPNADAFLFDTKGPAPGGNGYTFNWNILAAYPSKVPFIISGGIGLEQLGSLSKLTKTNLPVLAVDVNSRFETKPGQKNIEDLKKLFAHEL